MQLFWITAGCVIGVLATTVAMLLALAMCRVAAENDPESDAYMPNDWGKK